MTFLAMPRRDGSTGGQIRHGCSASRSKHSLRRTCYICCERVARGRASKAKMKTLETIQSLEQAVLALGEDILHEARRDATSVFDSDHYTGKLIEHAMEEEQFRVALFRFVDVLPSLTTPAEIVRHVHEYFRPVAHLVTGLLKWGLDIDPDSLAAKAAAALVKNQVRAMATRFILGEDPPAALHATRAIRKSAMAFTVDLLGEATVSEAEAEQYLKRYLDLIHVLAAEVPRWPESATL